MKKAHIIIPVAAVIAVITGLSIQLSNNETIPESVPQVNRTIFKQPLVAVLTDQQIIEQQYSRFLNSLTTIQDVPADQLRFELAKYLTAEALNFRVKQITDIKNSGKRAAEVTEIKETKTLYIRIDGIKAKLKTNIKAMSQIYELTTPSTTLWAKTPGGWKITSEWEGK
jgi:hypothetical protein